MQRARWSGGDAVLGRNPLSGGSAGIAGADESKQKDPMRLASVKTGDLVRVDDGLPYFAEVIERDGVRVKVSPITGPRGVRTVTARSVVTHWKRTGKMVVDA